MPTPAEHFAALADELAAIVRATLARHFPALTPQDREDIEQDVRWKFWSYLADGKNFDQAALYIRRMVFSTAIDGIRRRRRHLPEDRLIREFGPKAEGRPWTPSPETPEDRLRGREIRDAVAAGLASLFENREKVVRLHLSGVSLEESARLLGWTENKVRHLLYRGLADLRSKLREQGLAAAAKE